MAEVQLTKIRAAYGELKGYLESFPSKVDTGPYIIPKAIGENFNNCIGNLTEVSNTDYSKFKIPHSEMRSMINLRTIKALATSVISRLEQEYGFEREDNRSAPSIVIFNKNQNEISLQINYTINDLINKASNEESKGKLQELQNELEKPSKNWIAIKNVLIWILNFSKELFLEVIPIILQKKI